MHLAIAVCLVGALPASPGEPEAATPEATRRFSDEGTYAPSGAIEVHHDSYDASMSTANPQFTTQGSTTVLFAPGVDYFVADRFSLRLTVLGRYTDGAGYSQYAFGAGFGVGYYVPFAEQVGLYPRVVFYGFHERTVYDQVPTQLGGFFPFPNHERSAIYGEVELPILVHFSQFFIGLGPRVARRVWESGGSASGSPTLSTRIGIATSIGGWLD